MTKNELIYLSEKHRQLSERIKNIALYQIKQLAEISVICDIENEICVLLQKARDDLMLNLVKEPRA